jgi:L-2-hydroxyglutarate oxidase LhgO
MADTPLTIIGAGVVGLAIAARLAPRFPELVVLERRAQHGMETSSRNSEVMHAGMYYPSGSWKARLCVRGLEMLYQFCAQHGVAHRPIGKLIVAMVPEEIAELERILALGRANGVALSMLSGPQCRRLEPAVPAVAGLLSPRTGIVNTHELMAALLQTARAHGAILQPRAEVTSIERRDRDYRIELRTSRGSEALLSERVVNAAGLEADTIAALAGIDVVAAGYRLHWWKGSYFAVTGAKAAVVSRLVYPVPTHVSLGVHVVLGLDGRLRFGPDAEYLPERIPDYDVNDGKRASFGAAVRRLVPSIEDEDLTPDLAGIRPKRQGPGPGDGWRDFAIAEETARGLPGWINLIGIESPGLTSALAIAEAVELLLAP